MSKDMEFVNAQLMRVINGEELIEPECVECEEGIRNFQKIANYMSNSLKETSLFVEKLSVGDLSVELPSESNFIAGDMKELYSTLKNIIFQAEQIAEGNYENKKENVGEIASAVEKMGKQIQKREREYQENNSKQENLLRIFKYILELHSELAIVVDIDTGEILYSNKKEAVYDTGIDNVCSCDILKDLINKSMENKKNKKEEIVYERDGKIFSIRCFPIDWQGRQASLNYFMEVTKAKEKEEELRKLALTDGMTKTCNVVGYRWKVREVVENKKPISIVMIDLDNLKLVNDNWGHEAGDNFILKAVKYIRKNIRKNDFIARKGGDEFVLVMQECVAELAEEKMAVARQGLLHANEEYMMDFSYGVEYVRSPSLKKIKEAAAIADGKMYEMKRRHKQNLKAKNFLNEIMSYDSNTKEEHEEAQMKSREEKEKVKAYVDGSYDVCNHRFSYGVVIIDEYGIQTFNGASEDPETVDMRNVAGEIRGAEIAMKYAFEKGIRNLSIYHDYEGIAKWCNGEWKAKKKGTIAYKDFFNKISEKVEVEFVKVKSHSGNEYNDMADKLAKDALGI